MREECLAAYAHAELPFERLVEELRPQRDPSRSPLFQILFALDQATNEGVQLPGLTCDASRIDTETSKFDLSLHLKLEAERFEGYLEYSTELFDAETAGRLAGHYRTLLEAAAADPDMPLSRLPLLTGEERLQLERFTDTAEPFPEEHLLHRLVERQIARLTRRSGRDLRGPHALIRRAGPPRLGPGWLPARPGCRPGRPRRRLPGALARTGRGGSWACCRPAAPTCPWTPTTPPNASP